VGLRAAAILYGELVAGVGWIEFCDDPQPGGQGSGAEERILALAELAVVEVKR
jgi:hypothetical protein